MADADTLFAAIVAHKPDPTWDWVKTGGGAGPWLFALCDGFVTMWNVGLTGPGIPPYVPPAPLWPHLHMVLTLTSSLMQAKLTALGYASVANTFFGNMCSAISSYLISSSVIAQATDGLLPHTHSFTSFGSASALKSTIMGMISASGGHVDPMITAISAGIIDFLTANGSTITSAGPVHVHTLTV